MSYIIKLLTLILVLLWGINLSELFSERSYQFYFIFTLFSLIISIIVALHIIIRKIHLKLSLTELIGILFVLYIIVHSQLISDGENYKIVYYICSITYFIGSSYLFREKIISFTKIYSLFAWFSIIQVVIIILQYFNIIDSGNKYYPVMGTYNNPNITAMYIVLTVPYYLSNLLGKKKRVLNIFLIALILISLWLLQCRSAYLGLLVVFIIYFIKKKQVLNKIIKLSNFFKYIIIFLLSIVVMVGAVSLYNKKQDSADGRLFIWKVSINMIKDNPVKGYGYGLFEKEYNIYQAKYIQTNSLSEKEIKNAGHIYMPYNDFLEWFIQGGFLGFTLILSIVALLLKQAVKNESWEIIAILFAGLFMSLVNFVSQAIPVWVVLLLTSSYITSNEKNIILIKNKSINNLISILFILISSLFIFMQVKGTEAQYNLVKARTLIKENNLKEAIIILDRSKAYTTTYPLYLYTLGKAYMQIKEIDKGLDNFIDASRFSSMPDIYFWLSHCYMLKNQLDKAEECLLFIKNMIPSNFRSRLLLMQLYGRSSRIDKQRQLAEEVLSLPYKEKNKDAIAARNYAYKIITQY